MFSLTWMPDVLRAAGLTVQAVDGWQTRGHGDFGIPMGVLCHHTCGPKTGDIRDLHVLVEGRLDPSDYLPGPLCNLGLARSGVFWVVAAGRAYHAGAGNWLGIKDANSHMIGIEAENVGDGTDPWPDVQIDAYERGCAALLLYMKAQPAMCAGHKEYALPHGRKDDPDFDMVAFRAKVAGFMKSPVASPAPGPAAASAAAAVKHDTAWVQHSLNKLGQEPPLKEDGASGPGTPTYAALKAFQASHGIWVDGLSTQATIAKLIELQN